MEKLGEAAACAVKRIHLDERMAKCAERAGATLHEEFEVGDDVTFSHETGLWTVKSVEVRAQPCVLAGPPCTRRPGLPHSLLGACQPLIVLRAIPPTATLCRAEASLRHPLRLAQPGLGEHRTGTLPFATATVTGLPSHKQRRPRSCLCKGVCTSGYRLACAEPVRLPDPP